MFKFNADEILEMAEQIERNGAKFYRKAAQSAQADAGKLLNQLADMEQQHEKTFAQMRAELGGAQRRYATPDPDNQAAGYLQAVADGKVFDVSADPAETLTGNESLKEILLTAISLEKESVVFYTGIKELVGEELGREKIEAIIGQEMGHITTLSEQLAAVKAQA